MSAPFFSVVICNYNLAEFVGEAIDSALEQDYPVDLREVVVVDDGSTDESRARLDAYAGRRDVTVVLQANAGQASALASGVARARGDFVCLLDSDDWFLPHKLKRIAARLADVPVGRDVVLMHDYAAHDQQRGTQIEASWFATLGGQAGAGADLSRPGDSVRISIPCGQVYSRRLIQELCEGIPSADFRYGADVALGHAAFIAARYLHYLHEPLAVYRVHGGNEMASVDAGRLSFKNALAMLARWPKLLRYFEALVDSLGGEPAVRQERLAYLKRLSGAMHSTSASRRLPVPLMSFIVLGDGPVDHLASTLDSITAQTHGNVETIVVLRRGGRALDPRMRVGRQIYIAEQAPQLAGLAAGARAAQGQYLAFVPAGDQPDPAFAERLIHVLQYGTPAMLVVCDVRVVDGNGVLLHSSPFRSGGEWRNAVDYLPPLKTTLHETLFPPICAAVMRRSGFLDLLFEAGDSPLARDVGAQAQWLLLQLAHALGGTTRLSECHVTHRVSDGAEAAWSIRTSTRNPDGSAASESDVDAAVRLLMSVYCGARTEFRRVYPDTWRAEFIAWLSHGRAPETAAALRDIAARHQDEEMLDLLDALGELANGAPP